MKVTLQPSGAVLDVRPGERLLDAAKRLGYECPQSCRNGNCHICASLLVEGRVRQDGEVRDHGELLACLFSHAPVIRCSMAQLLAFVPRMRAAARELEAVLGSAAALEADQST